MPHALAGIEHQHGEPENERETDGQHPRSLAGRSQCRRDNGVPHQISRGRLISLKALTANVTDFSRFAADVRKGLALRAVLSVAGENDIESACSAFCARDLHLSEFASE
jgi:hypothetical protein